jgi:hypothetical protein
MNKINATMQLTFEHYIVDFELFVECIDGIPHILMLQPSATLGVGEGEAVSETVR